MPYIPTAHLKYDVLPFCRKHGREVFTYPIELLYELSKYADEKEPLDPYGFKSYEEYYDFVDRTASGYVNRPDIFNVFEKFKAVMKVMNCKEQWSILKYIGAADHKVAGLTHGRDYYWPCSEKCPLYEGVIDDDEYTSFWYPTGGARWEILEDPTGMASNTINKTIKMTRR